MELCGELLDIWMPWVHRENFTMQNFEDGNIILLKLAGTEKSYGVGNWY